MSIIAHLLALWWFVSPAAGAVEVPRSPAAVYLDFMLTNLDQIEANLPAVTRAAEAVADRLAAGGQLFIGGSQTGFATEGYYRAGGLMLLKYYQAGLDLTAQDTVLLGSLQPDEDLQLVRKLRERQVATVVFGPSHARGLRAQADYFLPSFAPAEDAILRLTGWDEALCPTAPVANVTNLWVFTAELVGALTRRGKMPTMFQSVMAEGGRDRNARYLPEAFHATHAVPAQPPGALGRAYLRAIRTQLQGLQRTQLPQLRQAGERIAQARAAGHAAYVMPIGHYPPDEVGRAGDPSLLGKLPDSLKPEELKEKLKPGDVLFYLGYTWMPTDLLKAAKEAGATTICAIAGGGGWTVDPQWVDLYLDPQWRLGDAAVELPGYDVNILPPSGVLQTVIYWSVVGEAAAVKR